ncbi:hypothetical protein COV04_00290 [Candidatus Uhrbacteria bacterium CG10_big_fil_rev_8_21_14_0_10_48_11]|uniref:Uncharacterized protein n=1 Tax=Candidatus Uhrbacteria bacterium CG10_big_fil_rev_8_21_14_0_10_48_11 TaxID=1975037 RepID=A0A2M8LFR9_9BACT|nr:MAG: hypothetical protein COV04_00290 [Candidatus Uhrbacteria bacterium CG10_big_fil_rev_8_21_14_0_10_48_11]
MKLLAQKRETFLEAQVVPLILTAVVCAVLVGVLFIEILTLNRFIATPIHLELRWWDIVVGLTIYLKTAVDFAIYMGHLMAKHRGWKNRVAIEIGTALGNGIGTFAILIVWAFFKEVRWLLAFMVTIASFVLLRLAEDSLEHTLQNKSGTSLFTQKIARSISGVLRPVNNLVLQIVRFILPDVKVKETKRKTLWAVFVLAFTVPFILGLDDFAGYVTLFNIVNVFGFAIGVFVGHMLLNIFVYLSPERTIRTVQNAIIALFGSIAFIGIALWGLVEVIHLMWW